MKYQLLIITMLLLASCKTPTQLLKEGNYKSAFKKAVREIRANKNIAENTKVIEATAKMKVDEAIQFSKIKTRTEDPKDWIETQTKVYQLLKDLGAANILTDGAIYEQYDLLCNEKKEVDYQIVDHFYEEGQDHLDRFYRHGQKLDARKAYYSLKKCEKYEGTSFFQDLPEAIVDAHQNGTVYYVSNYGAIANKLFLKQIPNDADFLPDCDIYVDQGFISIDETKSSKTKKYGKEVEVGREAEVDTSGNVTYKTLYETIEATVTTTTITVTASVTTYINCKNVTGQCTVKSSQFTTTETDTYKEIEIDGDTQALSTSIQEKRGAPSFFESDLRSRVMKRADRRVNI